MKPVFPPHARRQNHSVVPMRPGTLDRVGGSARRSGYSPVDEFAVGHGQEEGEHQPQMDCTGLCPSPRWRARPAASARVHADQHQEARRGPVSAPRQFPRLRVHGHLPASSTAAPPFLSTRPIPPHPAQQDGDGKEGIGRRPSKDMVIECLRSMWRRSRAGSHTPIT